MKFDEARRYLIGNFEDMNLEAVISIINNLREEYESTVEITAAQREYLEKANENNFKALDKKTTSELFVSDMPDKKTTPTLTVRQSIMQCCTQKNLMRWTND